MLFHWVVAIGTGPIKKCSKAAGLGVSTLPNRKEMAGKQRDTVLDTHVYYVVPAFCHCNILLFGMGDDLTTLTLVDLLYGR